MTIDRTATATRRALLAGILGGIGAWAAAAISRTSPVLANGEVIHVGESFLTATTTTGLVNTVNADDVFKAGSTGGGIGVHGYGSTGVRGDSGSGIGIVGTTTTGSAAVYGHASENTGIAGFSGGTLGVIPKADTGVFGFAGKGLESRGVSGMSPAGQGVRGETTSGRAVQGTAASGIGVRADSVSGTGLWATSSTGYALRTGGRVKLDKSAGIATIASAHSSVTVTPGIDLTTTSAVVATLNGSAGGSTAVKRIAINTTTNAFTIYLTANSTVSVKVAWIVLG